MADEPNKTFDKVIDIAVAAQQAKENAARATQKADYVEELAYQAKKEADQLKKLAASLASTAASTATIAMNISQFASFREAYNANQTQYQEQIDYDGFIDIISSGCRTKNNLPDDNIIIENDPVDEELTRKKLKKMRLDTTSREFAISDESGSDLRLYSPGPAATSSYIKPTSPESSPMAMRKRGSYSDIQDSQGREILAVSSSSATKQLKDPLQEKFPASGSTIDQWKEAMAASFESTGNIHPLWEDRYVDSSNPTAQKLSSNRSSDRRDSWQEKKALKRFQLKLANLDTGSSTYSVIKDGEDAHQEKEENKTSAQCHQKVWLSDADKRAMESNHTGQPVPLGKEYIIHDCGCSSDEEVDEIMKPKALRTLKREELQCPEGTTLLIPPTQSPRCLSPLLSDSEKEFYSTCSIQIEENHHPKALTKHKFVPPISPLSSPRQEKDQHQD